MGLIKKMTGHSFDEIVSVVILEQTQLYKSETKWGMTFGSKGFLGSDVIAMDGGQVPDGLVITFSITYRDGEKEIVKERSGTECCDRLLQLAMVSSSVIPSDKGSRSEPKADEPIVLQKNQLPNGTYIIGKEIPVGTFDFVLIYGSGTITKYVNDHDTTLGATTYFEHMGNRYDYEFRQCINVECNAGEKLVLQGNLVVQISRSKKVEIAL